MALSSNCHAFLSDYLITIEIKFGNTLKSRLGCEIFIIPQYRYAGAAKLATLSLR